ncbi:spermatogenesis associated 6-like protein isoform X2 [Microcaecilia unicolor]|uniref:Spermatogenesis associated 6-like protein isoform X2 n=1 Tax=Microcaecilia unicolor TaxID=1415580 RepID=A0A6P7X277_9AMPH|nr:spermatogenesis associated 6-like protein isoform X2 [Microcaecilia unicolor]
MPLKVVVDLYIQAITCPGVFLPEREDVYLNVCILGQWKETKCLVPTFPIMFHEKMRFEKVFLTAIDPADISQLLENDKTRFELTQLTPPVGEMLSFYEENTREFLYPEPRLTPSLPGVDREMLMKTAYNFPGIAPKIEFSTRTAIKELPVDSKNRIYGDIYERRGRSPIKLHSSPSRNRKTKEKNYLKPTQSSRSRSPSPYTRRRMCELYNENQQRLAHLNLGDFEFKPEVESRPPFVVRHVDKSKPVGEKNSSQLFARNSKQNSNVSNNSLVSQLRRALSFDSYEAAKASEKIMDFEDLNSSEHRSSYFDTNEPTYTSSSSKSERGTSFSRTYSDPNYLDYKSSSSNLNNSPLRRRLSSYQSDTWKSIHDRVRSLLNTHGARQRLSLGATNAEIEDVLERKSISLRNSPNNSLQEERYC